MTSVVPPSNPAVVFDICFNALDGMFSGAYHGKNLHENDLNAVLRRAARWGVTGAVACAGSLEDCGKTADLLQSLRELRAPCSLRCTVGVHPTYCSQFVENVGDPPVASSVYLDSLVAVLDRCIGSGLFVAIGEFGLDSERTQFCPFPLQQVGFTAQLDVLIPAATAALGSYTKAHALALADDWERTAVQSPLAGFFVGERSALSDPAASTVRAFPCAAVPLPDASACRYLSALWGPASGLWLRIAAADLLALELEGALHILSIAGSQHSISSAAEEGVALFNDGVRASSTLRKLVCSPNWAVLPPLLLHLRGTSAVDVFLEELRRVAPNVAGGVVHSFDGTSDIATKIIQLGFHIGLNGCSLRTEASLEAIQAIPLSALVVETDSPWCGIKRTHPSSKYVETRLKTVKGTAYKPKGSLQPCDVAPEDEVGVKDRNEPMNALAVVDVILAMHPQARGMTRDQLCNVLLVNTARALTPVLVRQRQTP